MPLIPGPWRPKRSCHNPSQSNYSLKQLYDQGALSKSWLGETKKRCHFEPVDPAIAGLISSGHLPRRLKDAVSLLIAFRQ
jgi:hypothetical protein